MDSNKVLVKIYGQEYVISGDSTREQIMQVADFVDSKMREVERALGAAPISKLAVLTALNMVDELFTAKKTVERLEELNREVMKECEHYNQLWEEAKSNYIQYKENAQSGVEKMEKLQEMFNSKAIEINQISQQKSEVEKKLAELSEEHQNLLESIKTQKENNEDTKDTIKEWEAKCKELENSFFDLQMENIKLKGEVDRYKRIVE